MNQFTSSETCPAELPNFCAQRHWSIFWVLILCSLVVVTGRIITIKNETARGDKPFFSANDRSRWCTVRALGDHGTFEIDEVIKKGQPIDWDSIDKVRHLGEDNRLHFYSSKPTLLPSLMAAGYCGVKSVTGWTIAEDTVLVTRILLVLFNATSWGVFLYFLALTINAIPVRDWSRYFVLGCGGFGTYLSTFAISFNNHVPAAVCVMISLYCLGEIWRKPNADRKTFFWCGLFAAFAASNELPALSFFAAAAGLCCIKSVSKSVLFFVPGALVVALAFFGTNYWAHNEWKPAYSHRTDGEVIATVDGDFQVLLDKGKLPPSMLEASGLDFRAPFVEQGAWPTKLVDQDRWVVRDRVSDKQMAITCGRDSRSFEIRQWNNWYDYPGSYWLTENNDSKSLVDRGQESQQVYAFHVLFGHHGIFSLTPIWLFSFAGMVAMLFGARFAGRFQLRWLGLLSVMITLVVLTFYINRPAMDRNYGGVCSALRWVFWLAPIWLVTMLPVVDWLAKHKWGQTLCLVLLFLSGLSAFYSMANPWVHPWLYEVWDFTGLPK